MHRLTILVVAFALGVTACSGPSESSNTVTVYSGRSEELVAPLIERYEAVSGIDVSVRYGDSAELAATILEEGDRSPASVFLSQDPGDSLVVHREYFGHDQILLIERPDGSTVTCRVGQAPPTNG